MTQAQSVALNDLKTYADWKSAPAGILLQALDADGNIVVGMHCRVSDPGSSDGHFFLILDGARNGTFLTDRHMRPTAADVSSILELRVKSVVPEVFHEGRAFNKCIIGEADAGSGLYFIRAVMPQGRPEKIWLTNPGGQTPVGTASAAHIQKWIVLGEPEVVRRNPLPK